MKQIIWLLALLIFPLFAHADEFETLAAKLPEGSYSDRYDILKDMVATGDERAIALAEDLRDGNLYALPDGVLVIKSKEGYTNAMSGEAVTISNEKDAKKVKANNSLRKNIDVLIAKQGFESDEPATRLMAATAAFNNPVAGNVPALEGYLAKETDEDVADMLRNAINAATLKSDAPKERKEEAIDALSKLGSTARAPLQVVAGDEELQDAYNKALNRIASHERVVNLGQNLWYGLSLGSVLLLAAVGLAITFGVLGVINMAHGELIMIGAYTTYVVQELIRNNAPWLFDYSLFIAIPAAFLVSGAVGVLIERSVVRWLYGRPLETLLATWGISLILQQTIRLIFGPNNREVGNPSWMSASFDVFGVQITSSRLAIVIFAVIVFVALGLLLRRTLFGLQMRAVTQNRAMASNMGISTPWIDALAFGLGAGLAGLAGVALSQIDNVSPNLGQSYIVDSFMVVVFGGAGNLWGAVAGAFTLGIANKFLEPSVGAVFAKIIVLVLIIGFIQKRPRGLFAIKGRAVEN